MNDNDPNVGRFRLELGGRWEIDDLEELVESLRTSYAYFYWVMQSPNNVEEITKGLIIRHFWSQKWQLEKTAAELYRRIPKQERLQLASMHYASPGWMEVAGWVSAMTALGICAKTWVKVVNDGFSLYLKVKDYFDKRKLNPPPQKFNLDDMAASDIDEARVLCFEYGNQLGFADKKVQDMIDLTGNPISALRLLTNLSVEARRMVNLDKAGKLRLPQ